METTVNYQLKKPAQPDYYNIRDFNQNADIVDAALKGLDEQVNRIGDMVTFAYPINDPKFLPADGQILAKYEAPALAEKLGTTHGAVLYPWTQYILDYISLGYCAAYGNNVYLVGGNGGMLCTSTGGVTSWQRQYNPMPGPDCAGATFTGNNFVIVGGDGPSGGQIATSPTGLDGSWTTRTSGTVYPLCCVTSNGARVLAGGEGGVVLLSSNHGASWTAATSGFGAGNTVNSVAIGENGICVAVGTNGKLAVSQNNGGTWALCDSGLGTSEIKSVDYGRGKFVMCGAGGMLASSCDGVSWQKHVSPFGTTNLNVVSVSGEGIIIGGDNGKVAFGNSGMVFNPVDVGVGTWPIYAVCKGPIPFVTTNTTKISAAQIDRTMFIMPSHNLTQKYTYVRAGV